ncbi:MAG: flagellar hook-length control protein FliK [Planctomycetota bacterium]|nr:flagellar hook-length control protein FliK [Planctomycetota bacterium]
MTDSLQAIRDPHTTPIDRSATHQRVERRRTQAGAPPVARSDAGQDVGATLPTLNRDGSASHTQAERERSPSFEAALRSAPGAGPSTQTPDANAWLALGSPVFLVAAATDARNSPTAPSARARSVRIGAPETSDGRSATVLDGPSTGAADARLARYGQQVDLADLAFAELTGAHESGPLAAAARELRSPDETARDLDDNPAGQRAPERGRAQGREAPSGTFALLSAQGSPNAPTQQALPGTEGAQQPLQPQAKQARTTSDGSDRSPQAEQSGVSGLGASRGLADARSSQQSARADAARPSATGPASTSPASTGPSNGSSNSGGGQGATGGASDPLAKLLRSKESAPGSRASAGERRQAIIDRLQQQALRGAAVAMHRDGGELTLRLRPDELGPMRIRLEMSDNSLAARFEVSTELARSLLEESADTLRASLASQGLRVHSIEVRVAPELTPEGHEAERQTTNSAKDGAHQQGEGGTRPHDRQGSAEERWPERGREQRQGRRWTEASDASVARSAAGVWWTPVAASPAETGLQHVRHIA